MMIESHSRTANEYFIKKFGLDAQLYISFGKPMLVSSGKNMVECRLEFWSRDGHVVYANDRIAKTKGKALDEALDALLQNMSFDQKTLQDMVNDFKKDESFIGDKGNGKDIMPDNGVPHEYKLKDDYMLTVIYSLDEFDKKMPILCQVKLSVPDQTLIDEKHWDTSKRAALTNLVLDRLQRQYPDYKMQLIDGFTCAFADLTKADDYYSQWY